MQSNENIKITRNQFVHEGTTKYCDQRVCLSVCPLKYLEDHMVKLHQIYVVPVLLITPRFHTMSSMMRRERNRRNIASIHAKVCSAIKTSIGVGGREGTCPPTSGEKIFGQKSCNIRAVDIIFHTYIFGQKWLALPKLTELLRL